jgi:aspartate/methionine/tyrosine aminotransferase
MAALRDANQVARAGKDVVHLSLGQPSREIPDAVRRKIGQIALEKPLGYTESTGTSELRQAISDQYRTQYQIHVPIKRIFITLGSSAAFLMSLIAAFDARDAIAITMPCYPAYPNMMKAFDVRPIALSGTVHNNFQPSCEQLKALPEIPDGLVIGSPSNPTGTILDTGEMERISRYCDENGIRIISDEIYHGVTYGKTAETILRFTQNAIVVNSFSKFYLMPGWRLGWAVVPETLTESFELLAQSFFLSPSALAQYVGLEVMQNRAPLDAVIHEYRANRDQLITALKHCGFQDIAPAEGAFYLYAKSTKFHTDSELFCKDMLHQAGVVAVSGKDFDTQRGHEYVRFSFAGSPADIAKACERLRSWLMK